MTAAADMQRRFDGILEARGGFEVIGQVEVGLDQFQFHQAEAAVGVADHIDASI